MTSPGDPLDDRTHLLSRILTGLRFSGDPMQDIGLNKFEPG